MIQDQTQGLVDQVREALARTTPLVIEGGGTKAFMGRLTQGEGLNLGGHRGVVAHEPSELVVTALSGTPLSELQTRLREAGQMLPFEPPAFGTAATIGGTIACGLSGPRRPFAGAARDFVLGVRVLNGKGEELTFGGQVMKNVAGYDLSRLMTGAMGTLGAVLEVSLKVLPVPALEQTLAFEMSAEKALRALSDWGGSPLPISAACHEQGVLRIRLSGTPSGVATARRHLGGEVQDDDRYWHTLREQEGEFFEGGEPLWRLSVPPATPLSTLKGDSRWVLDWGGALRWLKTTAPATEIRATAEAAGGHASIFRNGPRDGELFHPLSAAVLRLHQRLKAAFDPHALFNRGRMYEAL